MEKGPKNLTPLFNLLSVLQQNKAVHNFYEKGRLLIVECNIDLEYPLLCLPIFSLYFYSPNTEGVRPMLESNTLKQSDTKFGYYGVVKNIAYSTSRC